MAPITKGDYVLVSGASGFIAVHTVKELLQKGYKVRGTVRSKEKGEYLVDLFKGQGEFDYVLVEDIEQPGAFDEAVKGVTAVAHTASPFHFNIEKPEDLTGPAVQGTVGVLKSIQKNNPSIKRVVVTSSVAAILSVDSIPAPHTYTEKDWNKDSIPHVEKNGKESNPRHAYQASKTLAEKALWKFIEDEKPSWDAATINPPLVLGEVLQQVDSPEKLNTSNALIYDWAAGKKTEEDLPGALGSWVNVEQVAQGHVRALEVPEASGERFLTGAGFLVGQDVVDILHKRYPSLKNVPTGKPGTASEATKSMNTLVGKKATEVLGIKYESLEETVVQIVESLVKKGWLKV